MNTITLTLSSTLYQTLQTLATQTGRSPEEIATGLLEKALETINGYYHKPLYKKR